MKLEVGKTYITREGEKDPSPTEETALTAMCVWEWVWSTNNWSDTQRNEPEFWRDDYHDLCDGERYGWAHVRSVTLDTVAPAIEAAYAATNESQRLAADLDCFDLDFVPAYCNVMIDQCISPRNLVKAQDYILRKMRIHLNCKECGQRLK